MEKRTREIIRIDEDLCDGCGLCVPACAEKAIEVIDGKAKLIKESFCDGLGACLGDCPQGAITMERREAEPFDEEAVERHILSQKERAPQEGGVCAGSCETLLERESRESREDREGREGGEEEERGELSSLLRNWPIQLKLVSSGAETLKRSQWLIAADCVPFAFADFHRRFLKGRTLLIGCPKLDDMTLYYEKLKELFKRETPEQVMVLMMEVPCCSGLSRLVKRVLEEVEYDGTFEETIIGLKGEVKSCR